MGDVVNLNRARKAQAKDEAIRTAAANRAAFGRTKVQKTADVVERTRADRLLDGARIDVD